MYSMSRESDVFYIKGGGGVMMYSMSRGADVFYKGEYCIQY